MICLRTVKVFCNGDITQIENYEKALNDVTQTWDCHHRKETDEGLSVKQLIEQNLYFDRPANELIFLTKSEHVILHNTCRNVSDITKQNISNSHKGENNPMYGKHHTEKSKRKNREAHQGELNPFYGKTHSEESKRKNREAKKGKKRIIKDGKGTYCKPEELEYYLNNGWQLQKYKKEGVT